MTPITVVLAVALVVTVWLIVILNQRCDALERAMIDAANHIECGQAGCALETIDCALEGKA